MKKFISLLLSFSIILNLFVGINCFASAEESDQENEFKMVSNTDIFYGYTPYLSNYNNEMRRQITESIIDAGEGFGADDKFLASLETTLDTVGSFSKTFYALTDAVGLTSKLNDEAADKAINVVLKHIYEDENNEFWDAVTNAESQNIKAWENSMGFIDSFNKLGFENYTLNEIYDTVMMRSLEVSCDYDISIGKLDITTRQTISKKVYEYYGEYIDSWDQIIELTKCINTILFYQNVEIELIDYVLSFDNLDEDLIKGLNRVKSHITTNYASYFVQTITKEVVDEVLDEIGELFLIYDYTLVKLAGYASQFAGWLFFDVIYDHADANEYLTYVYLVKFLYSTQYEMDNRLYCMETDLVTSKTIDDFQYFYKIYSAIYKSSKKYAEKLSRSNIDFEYDVQFFDCSNFIEYVRAQVEQIDVEKRIEKSYVTDKTYQFSEPIIISEKEVDGFCLTTFHNKIMAPLVIDNYVTIDACDITVPKLTVNRSLTIDTRFTVDGDLDATSNAIDQIKIAEGGELIVGGDATFIANSRGKSDRVAKIVIDKGATANIDGDFILKGTKKIGSEFSYNYLYVFGDLVVGEDFEANSVMRVYDYGNIVIKGDANFLAEKHWVNVTNGHIYIYEDAAFMVSGDMNLKGANYYNTGNNWLLLYLYGSLIVDGNFSAENRFVALNQVSDNSVWSVKGNIYLNVLNDTIIYGFDVSSCTGHKCNLTAGTLMLGGDFNNGGALVTPSGKYTIIFKGAQAQEINKLTAPTMVITNTSAQGVKFGSDIAPTVLFDSRGNNYTLYNNGSGSTFVDYDGDGLKDNVDPHPTIHDNSINGESLNILRTAIINNTTNESLDYNNDNAVNVCDLVYLTIELEK